MRTYSETAITTMIAVLLAAPASAMSIGEFEYRNSCIACHGETAKGDGPFVGYLQGTSPPDLTTLQKDNGGVFPVTVIYDVIDGSDMASAHGTREMPIWGNRYRTRMDAAQDWNYSPEETEAYVRTRILSLIEYLSTLQEE